jgi:hypothetical protein
MGGEGAEEASPLPAEWMRGSRRRRGVSSPWRGGMLLGGDGPGTADAAHPRRGMPSSGRFLAVGRRVAAGVRRVGDRRCRAPSPGDAVLGVAAVARPRGGSRVPLWRPLRGAAVLGPPPPRALAGETAPLAGGAHATSRRRNPRRERGEAGRKRGRREK